jgi:ABC-2 type transport system permease protein
MSGFAALALATQRAFVRDKTSLFFTFVFPLVFLVVFGLIFRGQSIPGGGKYIDSIAPGVLAWGVANGAVFGVAFTLMNWRRTEVLQLIRMTPVRTRAVLSARFLVAVVIGLVQSIVFIGVALLPVFGLHLSATWPLTVPVVVLGLAAFFAVGMVIGTFAGSSEAVAAVANFIMLPMAFLSGAFFPMSASPGWLRVISRFLPLRYMTEGIARALSGEAGATGAVALCCAALAGFTVLFAVLASRTFRWGSEA